ncbi:MAG: YciI family protein [PS1 clade bacterium]|uniref:YciI family protein n=1 Tax=PS1 clade bacterium TaxID=2175152 RepID=A0A937HLZ6_9PROT|nr:YciI family protein [PS1 clade bacterium]
MYVIMAFDKPDSEALRLDNRGDHVAYVLGHDTVKTAGPFMSDDGDTMIGTLLVLNVESRAEAEAFVADDPYNKAGLFAQVEIRRWAHLIGGLEDPNS